jgi:hypothetical protein
MRRSQPELSNKKHGRAEIENGKCPFLKNEECLIYQARPVICRTHGLPLIPPGSNKPDCCPLNFPDGGLLKLKTSDFFDVARVTTSAMRLNIAFCMLLEDRSLSGQRFTLHSIISGNLPQAIMRITG